MQVFELVFSAVLIVGCLVFAIAVLRMTKTSETPKTKRKKVKKQKTKQKKPTKPQKKKVDGVEIPEAWRKQKEKNPSGSSSFKVSTTKTSRKIHVPGLRMGKRLLAAILLIINLFISQATLMSAPTSQPMFWLFILNSFILLDYLWRTRRRETI